MKTIREFNFVRSRRVRTGELDAARKAIPSRLGVKLAPRKAGRPPKPAHEKYQHVHILLHPRIIQWAKVLASRRGHHVGYQTIINETLLAKCKRILPKNQHDSVIDK
jgi:hypothetical protein